MSEILVIPTAYKTRPGFLSYPIGAEALTAAFVETPQLFELGVKFFWYSKERNSLGKRYRVLTISYSRMTPTLTTGKAALDYGWLEKQWEITVSPVPQERKHLNQDSTGKRSSAYSSRLAG